MISASTPTTTLGGWLDSQNQLKQVVSFHVLSCLVLFCGANLLIGPAVAGQNARSSQPVYTDWRGLNNLQRSTSGSQIRHTQLRLPANESTANRSFSNPFMHPEAYVSATAMVGPATARSVSNITTASPRAIGSERNTHRPQLNMNVPHLERPPPESMVSVSTGLLDELEYCRQAMKAQGRILEHCTSQLQLASSVLTRAMQCLSTTTNFGIVDGTTLTEDKKKLHAVVSTVCGVAKEHEKLIELLEMVQK